jgi:hypothetical protein
VNNDHVVNIYKINNNSPNAKNPYLQASNRYNNKDKFLVKNLDRNYEIYLQKKSNNRNANYLDVSQNNGLVNNNNKIVPNRKLSPINKKGIKM